MAVEEEEVNKIKERNNEADDIELNNLNGKNKEEDEKKAEEKAVDEEHGAKRDIWQNKYEYYAALIASSLSYYSMNQVSYSSGVGGCGRSMVTSIVNPLTFT